MDPTLGLRVTRHLLCILRLSLPQCHRWEGEHGKHILFPKLLVSGSATCHFCPQFSLDKATQTPYLSLTRMRQYDPDTSPKWSKHPLCKWGTCGLCEEETQLVGRQTTGKKMWIPSIRSQVLSLSSPPVPWLSPSISSQTVWYCLCWQIPSPSLHWLLLSGDTQQCLCILSDPKLLICHIHHCKSSRSMSLANLWENLSKCWSLYPHARVLDSSHITLLNCLSVDGRLPESPENLDCSAAQKLLSTLSLSLHRLYLCLTRPLLVAFLLELWPHPSVSSFPRSFFGHTFFRVPRLFLSLFHPPILSEESHNSPFPLCQQADDLLEAMLNGLS